MGPWEEVGRSQIFRWYIHQLGLVPEEQEVNMNISYLWLYVFVSCLDYLDCEAMKFEHKGAKHEYSLKIQSSEGFIQERHHFQPMEMDILCTYYCIIPLTGACA